MPDNIATDRIVKRIARRSWKRPMGRSLSVEDLEQAAYLALYRAGDVEAMDDALAATIAYRGVLDLLRQTFGIRKVKGRKVLNSFHERQPVQLGTVLPYNRDRSKPTTIEAVSTDERAIAAADACHDLDLILDRVWPRLSPRQRQIEAMILMGDEPEGIAARLYIDVKTIYSTRAVTRRRCRAVLAELRAA